MQQNIQMPSRSKSFKLWIRTQRNPEVHGLTAVQRKRWNAQHINDVSRLEDRIRNARLRRAAT